MKQPKILLGRALVVVAFVSCAFTIFLGLQAPAKNGSGSTTPDTPPHQATVKPPAVHDYGLPMRLKIPKINVDAKINQMGLTPEGDMQGPTEPQDAGWYKFGTHPGNQGSAVIAGHYGPNSKGTSVFNELHTLSKGDIVRVEDEKGAIAIFIVRELKTYSSDAAAPEVFSPSDEKAHLNLVTCKGAWQKAKQTYSDRLVVFTDSK